MWPNGCVDQDAAWYGGRRRPTRHCVRWGPSSPPLSGTAPPIFGHCPLLPNGWMDEAGTWHGGRPRPRRFCVRWGPSSPSPKGGGTPSPIFGTFLLLPNGWMHQDATWYGGRPPPRRLCIRWGTPLSPKSGRSPLPNLRPISIVAKRLDASRCHLVWM